MNDRQALLNALEGLVEELGSDSDVVDAYAVAKHLDRNYPRHGMPILEIVRLVELAAVATGAALLADSQAA